VAVLVRLSGHRQYRQGLAAPIAGHGLGQFVQLLPAVDDFDGAPVSCPLLVDAQNGRVVIRHHRIGSDIDGEGISKRSNTTDHPPLAMLEALAGKRVLAPQNGASDAAADVMIVRS
jgi:hypothetical protein